MKALIEKIESFPAKQQDIILLVLRFTLGIIFIQAGWGKFMNFDRTVGFFSSIGIPFAEINTILAAGTELVGGALVLIGLRTRLASVPLAFVMLVAIFTAHMGDIKGLTSFLGLTPWTYLVCFLVLGAVGAGKFSVDSKVGS